ncbi:MAG: AAA family ATPase [Deltaproteobacteria bacterium]|nr:AAA family ATPase [Deltaproteobacteria bacterium]
MEASLEIEHESISTSDRWPVSSRKDNRWEKTDSSKNPAQSTIVKSQEDDKNDQDIKRVSSGIADLDPLIQGGFPEGKSCLVTGEAGLGKSIFCMQFVLRGLVDGEKAVYVAVDSKPAEIVEEAASMGWDLHQYVEKKQLLILDASPYFSARMVGSKEKEIDISKTVADLASYVKRVGASRVVIDPVGPLIASQNATNGLRDRSRALIHALQENMGTTNLLTAYAINGARMGGHEAEEFPVNGVVVLKYARGESGLIRTLLLSKMRGTAIDLTEYQFDIVKEKGIVLSPIEPMTTPIADEIPESSESLFSGSLFKEWQSEEVSVH